MSLYTINRSDFPVKFPEKFQRQDFEKSTNLPWFSSIVSHGSRGSLASSRSGTLGGRYDRFACPVWLLVLTLGPFLTVSPVSDYGYNSVSPEIGVFHS